MFSMLEAGAESRPDQYPWQEMNDEPDTNEQIGTSKDCGGHNQHYMTEIESLKGLDAMLDAGFAERIELRSRRFVNVMLFEQ